MNFDPVYPAASRSQQPGLILVVDDETFVAQAVAALLRAQGHRTEVAHSGQQTLERLQRSAPLPNLVILDIAMPSMSGLEVLRSMREITPLRKLPVMMYSAFCDAASREEAERLSAIDYVVKNGDWPDLLRRVDAALQKTQESSTLAEPQPDAVS